MHVNFMHQLLSCCKEASWDSDGGSIESVDQFGKCCRLRVAKSSDT